MPDPSTMPADSPRSHGRQTVGDGRVDERSPTLWRAWLRTRARSVRRGTSATEFALILPILVILALACVDLGRFAYSDIAISNAARVAAQYGATHRRTVFNENEWDANLAAALREELAPSADVDSDRLDVQVDVVDQSPELPRIDVEVSYRFETVFDWPGLPHEIGLRRKVSMQQYR